MGRLLARECQQASGNRAREVGGPHVRAADGATRLVYCEVLANEKKETACGFLLRAVEWFSTQRIVVERILPDNRSAYRSHLHRQTCAEMGIRHSRTRPYRQRTNGKAERFIQPLNQRWAYGAIYDSRAERTGALSSWLRFCNHYGSHAFLNRQTSASRLAWLLGNNVLASHNEASSPGGPGRASWASLRPSRPAGR